MNSGRPPILEIRGLRKKFGDVEVLRGIDLAVKAQELVFVIGPSGSGKSTLLRCCNRLEEASAGSIRIDGADIMAASTNVNAMRRQIGMVFQSFNLYPHMTALGNVTLALAKVLGKPRAEAERLGLAALDRVGLAAKSRSIPANSPAASSSGSLSRARSRSNPRSCCSTSPHPRSIRSSSAACSMSCASSSAAG
jgi:polar amino acid transport system ATP-binding protein